MDHSHPFERCFNTTLRVCWSTTSVWSTTDMLAFSPLLQSATRSMENLAVSAVNSSPLENFTPSRR